MTPDIALHQTLTRASRRIRALLIARWVCRALCAVAATCLLWLLASKVGWLEEPPVEALLILLAVGAAIGAAIGLVQRFTATDVARLTDHRTGLKERLGTALEVAGRADSDPIARLQLDDAGAHAKGLDLRQAYPMRVPREALLFVVLALALFLTVLLPSLRLMWSADHRQEIEEVKRRGVEIEKIARDTEKTANKQQLDESKKAAKEVQKLAEAMKRGNLDKKQSMVRMAKLTKQLQEQQKRVAAENSAAAKPLGQAAEEIKRAMADRQKAVEQAAKEKAAQAKGEKKPGEKPSEKPGQQAGQKQTEAMQKAQEALKQFADALAKQDSQAQNQALQKLAEQLQKGQMTPEEMKALSQQLQQMSQALKNTSLDKVAKQLAQAAQQMRSIKLDPETLKKLAQMMKQAGGT